MSAGTASSKFETFFVKPMTKLAKQRHLLAVRDGMVSTIALTIVGSLFLIVLNLPVPASWKELAFFVFIAKHATTIAMPFRVTTGLIAIYATYNTGYSLAKAYSLDGKSAGTLSLMAFFTTTVPTFAHTLSNKVQELTLADGSVVSVVMANDLNSFGWALPLSRLGGAGIFAGIFSAILAVEVYRFFIQRNLVIKMPQGVPESVAKSFSALFPAFTIMVLMFTLIGVLGLDVQHLFEQLLLPVKSVVDKPIGAVVIVFLTGLLWVAGIHGAAIVGTIARPIWLDMVAANGEAMASNQVLPYITPEPFFQWFVWIGGSGASLSLVILLFFARSRYLRELGRVTLVPSLFNINEPVVFGLPIMLNPFFMIPFIFGPVAVTIISYLAVSWGWVKPVFAAVPWTTPAPIGAWLATGDARAMILVLVNIALVLLIYYPFVRAYDKKMLKEEVSTQSVEQNYE